MLGEREKESDERRVMGGVCPKEKGIVDQFLFWYFGPHSPPLPLSVPSPPFEKKKLSSHINGNFAVEKNSGTGREAPRGVFILMSDHTVSCLKILQL